MNRSTKLIKLSTFYFLFGYKFITVVKMTYGHKARQVFLCFGCNEYRPTVKAKLMSTWYGKQFICSKVTFKNKSNMCTWCLHYKLSFLITIDKLEFVFVFMFMIICTSMINTKVPLKLYFVIHTWWCLCNNFVNTTYFCKRSWLIIRRRKMMSSIYYYNLPARLMV